MTPLALRLLFQNPKSLIDVVVANEYLHLPSIPIVAAVTAVSLSEAARAAAASYGRDMIDEIGEHTYRREDMGQPARICHVISQRVLCMHQMIGVSKDIVCLVGASGEFEPRDRINQVLRVLRRRRVLRGRRSRRGRGLSP